MPQAAGGLVLSFAVLNGWLAARRGKSAIRWALGSILLAPVAWIMTLYLIRVPRGGGRASEVSPVWTWAKLAALIAGAAIVVMAISNYAGGLPAGGVVPGP
jgi:hypothetical protein